MLDTGRCRGIYYVICEDGCELVESTTGAVLEGEARVMAGDGWVNAMVRLLTAVIGAVGQGCNRHDVLSGKLGEGLSNELGPRLPHPYPVSPRMVHRGFGVPCLDGMGFPRMFCCAIGPWCWGDQGVFN